MSVPISHQTGALHSLRRAHGFHVTTLTSPLPLVASLEAAGQKASGRDLSEQRLAEAEAEIRSSAQSPPGSTRRRTWRRSTRLRRSVQRLTRSSTTHPRWTSWPLPRCTRGSIRSVTLRRRNGVLGGCVVPDVLLRSRSKRRTAWWLVPGTSGIPTFAFTEGRLGTGSHDQGDRTSRLWVSDARGKGDDHRGVG